MKNLNFWIVFGVLFSALTLMGCIKDDFIDDQVDPQLRITNKVDSLAIQTTFQFEEMYLNNVGLEEQVDVFWQSSNPAIVTISAQGLAEAVAPGSATISLELDINGDLLRDMVTVVVGENTVKSTTELGGEIVTTSSYLLEGDFTVSEDDGNLQIDIADNYRASTALPGFYVYLTNNRNSIANAKEIGMVTVFSGAHSYTIADTGLNDFSYILYYCKPFNIKVGEGEIK